MNAYTQQLLDEILVTHSPCGWEGEVEEIALRRFGEYCDDVWKDANDNVVGKIVGESSEDSTLLLAHKDEISTMVRKIDDDGKIWLDPLGGTVPWKYGEGPYDVLGDNDVVTGILSVGSTHSSHLSPRIARAKTEKPLDWETCYLDCKLNKEELAARGVRTGSLACISRTRKQPVYLQDTYVGCWGLDDKAGLVALFLAMKEIKESGRKPAHDVYFAATSVEELGISGAAYVCRSLLAGCAVSNVIAVEVAPVADEYAVTMDERPVILMKDSVFMYHPILCRELLHTCERLELGHQEMLVRSFGSDTSSVVKYGYIGRAGCVGFPTENTHGFEVAPVAAIENVGRLLAGYILGE